MQINIEGAAVDAAMCVCTGGGIVGSGWARRHLTGASELARLRQSAVGCVPLVSWTSHNEKYNVFSLCEHNRSQCHSSYCVALSTPEGCEVTTHSFIVSAVKYYVYCVFVTPLAVLRSAPRHRCSVRGDERCVRAVGEAAPRSLSRSRTLAPPLPVPLAPSLLSRAVSMAARPLRRARSPRAPISTFLYFSFLTGFPFAFSSDWSSTDVPAPVDAAELVRDAPLYPVLRDEHNSPGSNIFTDVSPNNNIDTEIIPDNDPAPAISSDANSTPDNSVAPGTNILPDNHLAPDTTSDAAETEHATNVQNNEETRVKRSAGQEHDRTHKSTSSSERRVKTGDTILNIRGAVRDAIGDAGAAPGPRASSRLDTFVIRPSQAQHAPRSPPRQESRHQHTPPQATKLERELLVEAHSVARISCEISNGSDVRWYKDGESLNLPATPPSTASAASAGGEGVWLDNGTLVVGRATRGDAAAWRCTHKDEKGNTVSGKPTRLLIYEPVRSVYLAVDGRRLDAGNTWVPVRDKTELEVRCVAEGGVPPPDLTWRLLALEPALDHRPYLRIHHTNYSIEGVSVSHAVVTAARELHNATLMCEARQRTPARSSAPAASPASPSQPAPSAPKSASLNGPLHVMAAKLEIHVTYEDVFHHHLRQKSQHQKSQCLQAIYNTWLWCNFLKDWNTGGSSSQPTVAPPLPASEVHSQSSPVTAVARSGNPPSFVISRWPGFGVSLSAGGAAALRCDVDANPPARAWWLRDDANPTSSPPPLEAGDEAARGSATLRWAALRGSHAGWYRCRATWLDTEYSSIGYYLNVISAPEEITETVTETEQEEEEPDHQKVEVPLGGNVQLHCPKGTVGCWWRRVVGNSSESWAPAGSHHAHGVLGIKDALYQEGGEYRCVGARGPDLMRLRELKRVTLKVTGGATATALSATPWRGGWRLECGACGRGVRVLWLRGGGAGGALPAALAPDLPQHCWRAVLHVAEPDEVWCVAAAPAGGAVAVFPRRAAPVSPAPARHTVRALHNASCALRHRSYLLLLINVYLFIKCDISYSMRY
ncbi:unnamed protein product [Arctia plantaginis]|uniref:Ig-like domain-containing protein n=1 Tax=Arctia plantaginis TaxID=874455 RepID=A0A8S1AAC7_ARCPL|nr:unnamed protein product [Arctia plantaginis]